MLAIAKKNMTLAEYAGPGHWNDPDMLEVGNGGMTDVEYRTHFSLWAVMAAPLLIGTDLRRATSATMEILLNTELIAINQDPLGVQARIVTSYKGLHVLSKPLADGGRAVALFNENDSAAEISTTLLDIGLEPGQSVPVRDVWTHSETETADKISATVPPHGTVVYRVGPAS